MANALDSANKYRQAIGQLLAARDAIVAIDQEYVSAGIASGITDDGGVLGSSDFPDIVKTQFTDGVGAAEAVVLAMAPHLTNLYIASDGSQR